MNCSLLSNAVVTDTGTIVPVLASRNRGFSLPNDRAPLDHHLRRRRTQMTFEPATNTGPMVLQWDSTPGDAVAWLPESAADRLRTLRQHVQDLRNLCPDFEDRRATAEAKTQAEQRLKRLTGHRSQGGLELPDGNQSVVAAREKLDQLAADLKRISDLDAVRTAAWRAASNVLSAVEAFLKEGKPPNTVLQDFTGPEPKPKGGESVLDALRVRRRARELKADLARIRAAPFPSSYARQQMRAIVDNLAARGAPSVSRLVELDQKDIDWPNTLLRSEVRNAEVPAIAFAEVPDTLALLVWLHHDLLLSRLDALISEESDDAAALSTEARQRQEAVVMRDLLAVEREESWFVWKALSERLPVEHRADCSPLALLGAVLVTAARADASPGTSVGMAFDLRR
jgi:hypothetical protein